MLRTYGLQRLGMDPRLRGDDVVQLARVRQLRSVTNHTTLLHTHMIAIA
jgi:hypothetical protein